VATEELNGANAIIATFRVDGLLSRDIWSVNSLKMEKMGDRQATRR
jgi:hypothetical protein